MTKLDCISKSRDISLLTKVCLVKAMFFPVVMYRCESWPIKKSELKNWWFWIVVLEKTLESPLDSKEIKPVNPKGNQPWIFIGRTVAGAPILWLLNMKSWFIGKDPDAGKDWRQEEKGAVENEIVDGITDWMDVSLSTLWETVKDREARCAVVYRLTKSHTGTQDLVTEQHE